MERVDEYLRRAAEADAAAGRATDPGIKRQFGEVAEQWRALARQAAMLANRDSGRGG